MKKFLSLLLVLCLFATCLVACDSDDKKPDDKGKQTTQGTPDDDSKPGDGTSAAPDNGTGDEPNDNTSAKPDDGTSAKPDDGTSAKPDDGTSAKPDDDTSNKPDDDRPAASLTPSDVEKDPVGAITSASANVMQDFLLDSANVSEIIRAAMEDGEVSLSFVSADLFSTIGLEGVEAITLTQRNDADRSSLNLLIAGGEDFGLVSFLRDGDRIGVSGELLFGTPDDVCYVLDLPSLADSEALMSGSLPALFGWQSEEELANGTLGMAMISTIVMMLEDQDWASLETSALAALTPTVGSGEIDGIGDESVSCVTVTYTLDIEAIQTVIAELLGGMELSDAFRAQIAAISGKTLTDDEIKATLASGIIGLLEQSGVSVSPTSYTYYLSAESGELVAVQTTVTETDPEYGYSYTSETTVLYAASGMLCTQMETYTNGLESDIYGSRFSIASGYAMTDVEMYYMTAESYYDGEFVTDWVATLTCSDGIIQLVAGKGDVTVQLDGRVTSTEDSAEILFTSLSIFNFPVASDTTTDLELELELKLSFKTEADAYAIPDDAKDLVTMSPEDWTALMEGVSNSVIGGLLGSMLDDGWASTPAYVPEWATEEYGDYIDDDTYEHCYFDEEGSKVLYYVQTVDEVFFEELVTAWIPETILFEDYESTIYDCPAGYVIGETQGEEMAILYWTDGYYIYALCTNVTEEDLPSIAASVEIYAPEEPEFAVVEPALLPENVSYQEVVDYGADYIYVNYYDYDDMWAMTYIQTTDAEWVEEIIAGYREAEVSNWSNGNALFIETDWDNLLVWSVDGMYYVLEGDYSANELIEVAQSVEIVPEEDSTTTEDDSVRDPAVEDSF